jgi:hypothetical protein
LFNRENSREKKRKAQKKALVEDTQMVGTMHDDHAMIIGEEQELIDGTIGIHVKSSSLLVLCFNQI